MRAVRELLASAEVQIGEYQAWIYKPITERIHARRKTLNLWLTNPLPPGDVLVDTVAIASLHRTYPGEYRTNVDTTWNDVIWAGNPHIDRTLRRQECQQAEFHYNAIHEIGRRDVSFMQAVVENLARVIDRPLNLEVTKPQIYLSDQEKSQRLRGLENIGSYVVLNAGYKHDYPAKFAGSHIWQQVVDTLKHRVTFVQVGEVATDGRHYHKPLNGALNLIGKTTPRDMFSLVHHSLAGMGPVSMLLHLCAGLDRPYICTGGGREEQNWIAYSSTIYLHTLGMLNCCKKQACWSTLVEPDPSRPSDKICSLPVLQPDGQTIPRCHQLVGSGPIISFLEVILDAHESSRCPHEGKIVSICPRGNPDWDVRECSKHGHCVRKPGRQVQATICDGRGSK